MQELLGKHANKWPLTAAHVYRQRSAWNRLRQLSQTKPQASCNITPHTKWSFILAFTIPDPYWLTEGPAYLAPIFNLKLIQTGEQRQSGKLWDLQSYQFVWVRPTYIATYVCLYFASDNAVSVFYQRTSTCKLQGPFEPIRERYFSRGRLAPGWPKGETHSCCAYTIAGKGKLQFSRLCRIQCVSSVWMITVEALDYGRLHKTPVWN